MSDLHLFSSMTVRDVVLRNRLWVAPMCQYSVDLEDGVPTDWHLVHLGAFARGGAGLVISEASAVSPEGRISAEDTGIWNDEQRDAWRRIVDFIHTQGAAAGIQLAHAGRKASVFREWSGARGTRPIDAGGWQSLAPSAVAFEGYATPEALDADGIGEVVADFAAAARRALDAGFDVLELHAAHGYLVHQFLSPLSNLRTDEWGGSLENRARLLLRIVEAVRAEAGEAVPVIVRFSATDWADGGWTREETATVASWAKTAGADLFDISTGGLVAGTSIPIGPGYQVPFAEFVGETSDVDVAAVGLITEARQADDLVRSGRVDAVLIGRELLRDPHFALRAAAELGHDLDYAPRQYHRGAFETA